MNSGAFWHKRASSGDPVPTVLNLPAPFRPWNKPKAWTGSNLAARARLALGCCLLPNLFSRHWQVASVGKMAINLQKQIRDNTLELNEFLNDLKEWERSMKEKDKKLKNQASEEEKTSLPPVRGRVQNSHQPYVGSKSRLDQREIKSEKVGHSEKQTAAAHTYDYFRDKWDKFDVDSALREVDEERENSAPPRKAAATEIKKSPSKVVQKQNSLQGNFGDSNQGRIGNLGTSTAIDRLSSVLRVNDSSPNAASEKEQGNEYFKEKKYVKAIECYSRSIALQPTAVAFANRGMAYIKIRSFEEAEHDCSEAINLDDRYVKAYSRRGTARRELGMFLAAVEDFEFALRLEPDNKELKKQYLEARALCEKGSGAKLPEKKVPIVIQEVTSDPLMKSEEKTQIAADCSKSMPASQGGHVVGAESVLSGDSLKTAVECTKAESQVKQSSFVSRKKQDALPSAQAAAARAASRTMAAVAQNMTAPKSAYEFEVMWKGFSGDRSSQSELLKIMDPSSLPKVFKNAMAATLLMDIIRCIELFFIEHVDFAVRVLENLTKVARFDMTVMCLSSRDKADLRRMWEEVFTNERIPADFQEALNRLRLKYCR